MAKNSSTLRHAFVPQPVVFHRTSRPATIEDSYYDDLQDVSTKCSYTNSQNIKKYGLFASKDHSLTPSSVRETPKIQKVTKKNLHEIPTKTK